MTRFAFVFVVAAAAGCSRSALLGGDDAPLGDDASFHPSFDAAFADAAFADAVFADAPALDAGVDAPSREPSPRCTGPLQGWSEVDVVLGGDFQGLVPVASPAASGIWLAGGGRSDVQGVTRLLRVEVRQASPRIAENMALAGTEGWEPLALAVANDRFALVARSANGDAWVALFARDGTPQERRTIDELQVELGYNMEADVAWAGSDVVVAALRYGQTADHFVVQRRDAALGERWNEAPWNEPRTTPLSFRFRPDGTLFRTRVALYDVTLQGLHRASNAVSALETIGAASAAWMGIDSKGFVLERDDGSVVHGQWPGHQWSSNGSIPAYESAAGLFITGNVELGPFIGWFGANDLQWIAIPHIGGGGVAFGDANDVGAFFAGLEIPRPEQPLRYWGCTR